MLFYLAIVTSLASYCLAYRWIIVTHTGKKSRGDTHGPVSIQIFGSKGAHRPVRLDSAFNDFEWGDTNYFKVVLPDIGVPRYIKMKLYGNDGWYLETVKLAQKVQHKYDLKYVFHCNCWIDDSGYKLLFLPMTRSVKWRVTVMTGITVHSDTDESIYLKIAGDHSNTTPLPLDNADKNDFKLRAIDVFNLDTIDIGEPKEITLYQYGTDGWFVSWVEVQRVGTAKKYKFHCNYWLDNNETIHVGMPLIIND